MTSDPARPGPRGVLVTGGSRGIGRAIAVAFARTGADVAFTYRTDRSAAEATAREVERAGRSAFFRACDAADPEAAAAGVEEARASLGRLDVVVTNAGGVGPLGWDRPGAAEWTGLLSSHLVGPYAALRAAAPELRRTRGSAVVIASTAGLAAYPGQIAYSAAKAGALSLARSLALALAPEVRVNAVAPGWVRTDLTRELYDPPKRRAAIERGIPRGRWGTPEDVASAVLFLASDGARFITGETLVVDGGESIAWRVGVER